MGVKWSIAVPCAVALLLGEGCQPRKGSATGSAKFEGRSGRVIAQSFAKDDTIVCAVFESSRGAPKFSGWSSERGAYGGIRQTRRVGGTVGSTVFESVTWRPGETRIVVAGKEFHLPKGEVFLVAWHEGEPQVTQVAHHFGNTGLDFMEMTAHGEEALGQLASDNQQVADFVRQHTEWHPESAANTRVPNPAD